MQEIENNALFWQKVDTLVLSSSIEIDYPKGSKHKQFTNLVYPVDYGYLTDTIDPAGDPIHIYQGSKKNNRVDALVISAEGVNLSENPVNSTFSTVTSVDMNEDTEINSCVSPAEARRMTPQTRRIVAAAKRAMEEADILKPDAVVCATQYGCMLQSMRFLQDMIDSGEQQLKPTPFIQSTHNTIASLIAILTGNNGYNATYSQGKHSLDCALKDIQTQLSLGLINNALVLEFDEQVDAWDNVLRLVGDQTQNIAKAYIVTK